VSLFSGIFCQKRDLLSSFIGRKVCGSFSQQQFKTFFFCYKIQHVTV